MSSAAGVEAEMEAWALKKWTATEGRIESWKESSLKKNIIEKSPEDTGLLKANIDAKSEKGVFMMWVSSLVNQTTYPANPNRDTRMVAFWQEYGTKRNRPHFMFRDGSQVAYAELANYLSSEWV